MAMGRPGPDAETRVAAALGEPVRRWAAVQGGETSAETWVAECGAGRSAFVKVATDTATATALRSEWTIYSRLRTTYLPKIIGWDDDGASTPILILEDLASGTWPPPWHSSQIRDVVAMLGRVAATEPPAELPLLETLRPEMVGWGIVADAPMSFRNLGLCTTDWLDGALPRLLEAEAAVPFGGSSLVHGDVRGPNVCFTADRVVLLDWSNACVGNPLLDVAFWLTNLCADGGPEPDEVVPEAGDAAAVVSGFFARRACELGARQRRYLQVALDWSARVLDLAPPQPSSF